MLGESKCTKIVYVQYMGSIHKRSINTGVCKTLAIWLNK